MLVHACEKSFQVVVIYFLRLSQGPCVGVVACSELLLRREALLVFRVPELIFALDSCLLFSLLQDGEVVEIIDECVHVCAR